MFTSKEPGRFPRDPEPYEIFLGGFVPRRAARVTFTGEQGSVRIDFAPRPQFNTPVNWVLAHIREDWFGQADDHLPFVEWLGSLSDTEKALEEWSHVTSEQIEHARKVLTRLAALTEGGTNENG